MAKTPKSVSKAASVLASDNSSADAKSLAGSVLATSDDKPEFVPGRDVGVADINLTEEGLTLSNIRTEHLEEEPLVRFQDESPEPFVRVDVPDITGFYDPEPMTAEEMKDEGFGSVQFQTDLADSETLDEFPAVDVPEVEEAIAPILPKDIGEQVAAAKEAAGHVAVTPNSRRD